MRQPGRRRKKKEHASDNQKVVATGRSEGRLPQTQEVQKKKRKTEICGVLGQFPFGQVP
jgi:hypothetical protein